MSGPISELSSGSAGISASVPLVFIILATLPKTFASNCITCQNQWGRIANHGLVSHESFTGVLLIENAMSLFHTQDLARGNYSAELTEILHGTLLGDSAWDSRGFF